MCAVRNSFFCTKIKYIINYKNLFIHTSPILRKVRNKIRKLQKISKNYFVCWEIWGSRSPDQYTRLVISINSGVLIAATQTLVYMYLTWVSLFSSRLYVLFYPEEESSSTTVETLFKGHPRDLRRGVS